LLSHLSPSCPFAGSGRAPLSVRRPICSQFLPAETGFDFLPRLPISFPILLATTFGGTLNRAGPESYPRATLRRSPLQSALLVRELFEEERDELLQEKRA
jgi:hypothetical protein